MTRDERLLRLEENYSKMVDRLGFFAEQLAEANLRIRFTMSAFVMTRPKPGGLVDPQTNQPVIETTNLFMQYLEGGRERLLKELEDERRLMTAAMAQMSGEDDEGTADGEDPPVGEDQGEDAGGGEGEASSAESGGAERAPEDPAGSLSRHGQSLRSRFAKFAGGKTG